MRGSGWPFDGCQFCGSVTHAMADTPGPLCSCVGVLARALWVAARAAATPRNEHALRALFAAVELGEPCCEPVPCSLIWSEDAICEPCSRARLAFYELVGEQWVPELRVWTRERAA